MPPTAPPSPEPTVQSGDAFADAARKLDALLGKAGLIEQEPSPQAEPDELALDMQDATGQPGPEGSASKTDQTDSIAECDPEGTDAELAALLDGDPDDTTDNEFAPEPVDDEQITPDELAAMLDAPSVADVPESAAEESALKELGDLLDVPPDRDSGDSQDTTAPSTDASAQATDASAPAPAGTDAFNAPDPTPQDLDAEIEALLSEQAIDPEVIEAAEGLATRDAEEAERNQEALRQRAAEAEAALRAADEPDPADTMDAITAEIDGLLASVPDDPPAPAEDTAQVPDPTIDQIDQMLAAEADDDAELAGEFFSATDVAAGITPGQGEPADLSEDVEGDFAPSDEVTAEPAVATAAATNGDESTDAQPDPYPRISLPFDWQKLLKRIDRLTLQACWLINWPARRFLTAEWRSTLGYLALLQAGGALAVWVLLVIL